MSLIDDIRKDREADGQPGDTWYVRKYTGMKDPYQVVCRKYVGWVCNLSVEHTARRIARVPDMEGALLAAEELADAVARVEDARDLWCDTIPFSDNEGEAASDRAERRLNLREAQLSSALNNYRKATGAAE